MPVPVRSAIALTALLALLAGCLAAPPASPAGAPAELGSAARLEPSQAEATTWFDAANGVPFSDLTWFTGCFDFTLHVPEGAAGLEVAVAGPAVGPGGGAGFMTLRLRHGDGEAWTDPPASAPSERVAIQVEAPAAGSWQVWVWPNGPVVRQSWQVTAAADVPPGSALALEPMGPDC